MKSIKSTKKSRILKVVVYNVYSELWVVSAELFTSQFPCHRLASVLLYWISKPPKLWSKTLPHHSQYPLSSMLLYFSSRFSMFIYDYLIIELHLSLNIHSRTHRRTDQIITQDREPLLSQTFSFCELFPLITVSTGHYAMWIDSPAIQSCEM